MLQNEYLVVKIGVDTAENEPSKVGLPARTAAAAVRAHGHAAPLALLPSGSRPTADAGLLPRGPGGSLPQKPWARVSGLEQFQLQIPEI